MENDSPQEEELSRAFSEAMDFGSSVDKSTAVTFDDKMNDPWGSSEIDTWMRSLFSPRNPAKNLHVEKASLTQDHKSYCDKTIICFPDWNSGFYSQEESTFLLPVEPAPLPGRFLKLENDLIQKVACGEIPLGFDDNMSFVLMAEDDDDSSSYDDESFDLMYDGDESSGYDAESVSHSYSFDDMDMDSSIGTVGSRTCEITDGNSPDCPQRTVFVVDDSCFPNPFELS